MSNFLKSKLILIICSVVILTLIPLFKSNFNAQVTFYKWKKLDWDDFQGFVKPFTGWGAGISSNVYVEYDSTKGKYVAYAAMNNQLSWKKQSSVGSDYLLNHEQYHFNITEYFARKLNSIIEKENIQNKDEALLKLSSIRSDLSKFQNRYDNESDHGINKDLQRRWEFQVDSLLEAFEQDSGFVIDYYSGGMVLMPSKYSFFKGIHESESIYRMYQLEKYDMTLAMTSFQYIFLPVETMTKSLRAYYENDSLEVKYFEVDSITYNYIARVEAYDSVELKTTLHLWVHHENYLYKLTASFPVSSTSIGYRNIANSFINSFKILDTKEYWLNKFHSSNSGIILNSITPHTNDQKNGEDVLSKCATYGESKQYGFYGRPIFRNDGAFLLPYNIIGYTDSLIHEVMLLHNDGWYSYEKESEDQIFFIPEEKLDGDIISIDFGYLLKQDTVNECFTFYYQNLEINRQVKNDRTEL